MRLRSLVIPLFAFVGCGSISDPSKSEEHTATVSGALTGASAPANARVALVWRNGKAGGLVVGADVPVVAGKFTMTVTDPADGYFFPLEGNDGDALSGSGSSEGTVVVDEPPTSTPASPPTPSGGAQQLHPKDTVSGGITTDLLGAVAGFVLYEDTNGNGKLDYDANGVPADTVIGGNRELMIVDLRGGGSLDYEKLRDKSGILPVQGLNLMWTGGRWFGLDLVELKITSSWRLPSEVCSQWGSSAPISSPVPEPQPAIVDASAPGDGGPSPDPHIHCAADGRSYTYENDCPPYVPPPRTLCSGDESVATACACGYGEALAPGQAVPPYWPCVVPGDVDGGPAPDAGSSDAGK